MGLLITSAAVLGAVGMLTSLFNGRSRGTRPPVS